MTAKKTIRNFPTPYPGECLYSLFSRYHVRSGNASCQNTAEDLFGNPMYTFHSSVTTPYRLEFVQRWYPRNTEEFAKQLLLYHTSFQYYCLFCWPERRKEYYGSFCQAEPTNYKPAALMAREISSGLHHLRYCPVCAKEEIERYGEPYWSVINQIDGVDFCPVHSCRLCDSSVSSDDTRRKLKPASQILTRRRLARKQPVYASTWLDQECLTFSKDVYWLLNHGAGLDYDIYNRIVCNALSKNLQRKSYIYYGSLTTEIKKLIMHYVSAELLKKMETLFESKFRLKNQKRITEYNFYAYFLPTRVLVIQYLYGSAENLGEAVHKESTSDSKN